MGCIAGRCGRRCCRRCRRPKARPWVSTALTSPRRRSVTTCARKRAMGWPVEEVFVLQVHAPGVEAEVDWGEAAIDLAGTRTTVHLFVMRASFSGAAFCQASLVQTQQA